jgi:uncharacterized damage-inducible protein DinB
VNTPELLEDAFGRVREAVHGVVEGLSLEDLCARIDGNANSIAWLVWHLTRVQDDHVSEVAGSEQLWTSSGWRVRFGLPLEPTDTGYSHTSEQVGVVSADADALLGYFDSVHEATLRFVRGLRDTDLDRVVDERWDPPVTLGVRLVSVVDDDLEHAGQAAFVRGVVERR